jgi:hypothetical protein
VTAILIPIIVLLFRAVTERTQIQDKLIEIADDLHKLAESTERRLRWLEENTWLRLRR